MKADLIFSFDNEKCFDLWRPINDVVMGGLSVGRFQSTGEGTGLFVGNVSLENAGGFASVRTLPGNYDLSGYDGIALEIRGDGKRYKLNLRTDDRFDGVTYQGRFETGEDVWMTLDIPFADFVPTFRGVRLARAGPLDPGRIRTFGFLISDKQEGPFRLEVRSIKAYFRLTRQDSGGYNYRLWKKPTSS